MGRVQEQGQLFYRFRLDNHVPNDHFLRRVDQFLDFKPLRAEIAPLYSHTGRPSINTELMIRRYVADFCSAPMTGFRPPLTATPSAQLTIVCGCRMAASVSGTTER